MKMICEIKGYGTFWDEAVKEANFIRNRMFTEPCSIDRKQPFECVMNKKTKLYFLRKLRSKAFPHIPKDLRKGKFDAMSTE